MRIHTNKELSDYCELYVDLNSEKGKKLIEKFKKRFGKRARIHPIELTDSPKGIPFFSSGLATLRTYSSIRLGLGLGVAERYFDDLTKTFFSIRDKVDINEITNYLISKYPNEISNKEFILGISKSWMESYSDKTV